MYMYACVNIYIYVIVMCIYRCCSCLYIDRTFDLQYQYIHKHTYQPIYLQLFIVVFISGQNYVYPNSIYSYHAMIFLYIRFYIHSVIMTRMFLSLSHCNSSTIQTIFKQMDINNDANGNT